MRLHYIQHVPFETPGSILDWATTNGLPLSSTLVYEGKHFPAMDTFDMLVVMGGPMGADDEQEYDWLADEKSFIRDTIRGGKAVIGICLGAQLVASVLGSRISKNRNKEIGWYPVRTTRENTLVPATACLPREFTAFHWHGDTFDLPPDAVRIAASDGCDNQGFLLGDRILGLQFHLEVTERSLEAMVENGRHELVKEKFVQDESEILSGKEFIRTNNRLMSRLLTNIAGTL